MTTCCWRAQHNLRDYLQSQGYFEAEVAFKPQRVANDQATIDYIVNAGPRHKLVAIEISGNTYFTTESIRERMYLQVASFLQFPHGRYSESLLRRDHDSIVNLYQSNGFREVKVNSRDAGQLSRQARRPRRLSGNRGGSAIVCRTACGWMASSTWTEPPC